MREEDVVITLKKEEALVLFEYITKFNNENKNKSCNSDTYALWSLENALEEKLAEPFLENYDKIILEARKKLVEFYKLK